MTGYIGYIFIFLQCQTLSSDTKNVRVALLFANGFSLRKCTATDAYVRTIIEL